LRFSRLFWKVYAAVTRLFHNSRRHLCCFLFIKEDEAITGCMITSLRASVQEIGYPRRRTTAAVAHTQDVSVRNTGFLLDEEDLTRLAFTEIIPDGKGGADNELRAQIALTPAHARSLAMLLEKTVENYERNFGKVEQPDPPNSKGG
jgi:hypothetical protein